METAVERLAAAAQAAAELAERAAETGMVELEAGALDLYGIVLDAAAAIADALKSGEGELAVSGAYLGGAVLQGRAALASRQVTAEALAAARQRGFDDCAASGLRCFDGTTPPA